jgi:hypothetical protein
MVYAIPDRYVGYSVPPHTTPTLVQVRSSTTAVLSPGNMPGGDVSQCCVGCAMLSAQPLTGRAICKGPASAQAQECPVSHIATACLFSVPLSGASYVQETTLNQKRIARPILSQHIYVRGILGLWKPTSERFKLRKFSRDSENNLSAWGL